MTVLNPAQPPPFQMGRVALTVNDLDGVHRFYEQAVGLNLLRGDGETAELGAGQDVLRDLRRDTAARRRSPRACAIRDRAGSTGLALADPRGTRIALNVLDE